MFFRFFLSPCVGVGVDGVSLCLVVGHPGGHHHQHGVVLEGGELGGGGRAAVAVGCHGGAGTGVYEGFGCQRVLVIWGEKWRTLLFFGFLIY